MYKIKIIGSRCELIAPDHTKQKFSELYELIRYAKNHKITIDNKNELPQFYAEMLK
jgi:hypothetical protein